jgi:hypothetical protein
MTGAVDARDAREDRPSLRLTAGAQRHVEHAIDRRGVDFDAHFTETRFRIRDVLVPQDVGRPVGVKDDRLQNATGFASMGS